jgi:hypothetical protein
VAAVEVAITATWRLTRQDTAAIAHAFLGPTPAKSSRMPGPGRRFVYVIRSDSNPDRRYVGIASNVRDRLVWHNTGPCGYSSPSGTSDATTNHERSAPRVRSLAAYSAFPSATPMFALLSEERWGSCGGRASARPLATARRRCMMHDQTDSLAHGHRAVEYDGGSGLRPATNHFEERADDRTDRREPKSSVGRETLDGRRGGHGTGEPQPRRIASSNVSGSKARQ